MIKIDVPKINFNKNFIKNLDLEGFYRAELLNVRKRIVDDTQRGKQAEGAGLKAYSPSYAAYKKAKTDSSTTNLTVSGDLMNSIVDSKLKDGYQLAFQGQHRPPTQSDNPRKKDRKPPKEFQNAELAGWLYEKGFKGWFTYSKKDIDRIWESLKRRFGDNIKNIIDIQQK